jgi:DnaJ-class molecular chaperone
MNLVMAHANIVPVECPQCSGTGLYEGKVKCELCDGQTSVPKYVAEEHVKQWAEYREFYNEHMSTYTGKTI